MVDSVDELEDVKNGMGVSNNGDTDDNVVAGVFGTSGQDFLQEGDSWLRLEDHGDLIEIREGSFSMLLTPKQVDHLHFMLGVYLQERDNV